MSRMVGGTFGVAAIGALFQHLARAHLEDTLSGLPISGAQREHLVDNLGSGSGGHLDGLDPALAAKAAAASKDAFIHALASGMWLSTGVAATGAILAFWLVAPSGPSAGAGPGDGGSGAAGGVGARAALPAREPAAGTIPAAVRKAPARPATHRMAYANREDRWPRST